ncbi:PD-(D/E)XK nuclease-like domain-containing protein [Thomasclavelia cocleata]|uniref:PD-(D/E)XK nuclease-like domain-containing protein n=1 Tax=Thomasclavelia cocleata TaxID=69824 RepID=UPI0024942CD0|nr:PD-(D/E)XK nuclease-like domain-containing protein [Thomasclavelia cocleata]
MALNSNNYYESNGYMSASLLKQFMKCEHTALAMYKGKYILPKNTAMLIGGFVDAWCEGTLDAFQDNNPEIFNKKIIELPDTAERIGNINPELVTKNGNIKKDKLSRAKKEYPEMFKTEYTLKSDFIGALDIINKISNNKMFMEFLTGEKQKIVTGQITGIPFKGKLDVYNGERIVDLKIMRTCERIMGKSLVEHWGFDIQLAIYQELIYQETSKRLPCYLAIATKEDPADLAIVEVNQTNLNIAMETVRNLLPRIKKIINGEVKPRRCNHCEHCRETKELKIIDSDLLGMSDEDIFYVTGEEN